MPFAAGSSTDIIARIVLDEVSRQIGQTIVVENRAGASGTIGSAAVAKADPDGYTILVHSSSHTVTPSTYTTLPYDTEKDFAPVMPLATIPNVVVVNGKRDYKTLKDMVDAAKAKPGSFNFASAGAGSATHLTAERLKLSAKIEAAHVAFKGSSEALTEILADRLDFYCSPVNAAIGFIKDGKHEGAGGQQRQALLGAARRADHRGGGLPGLRLRVLDRRLPAAPDARPPSAASCTRASSRRSTRRRWPRSSPTSAPTRSRSRPRSSRPWSSARSPPMPRWSRPPASR